MNRKRFIVGFVVATVLLPFCLVGGLVSILFSGMAKEQVFLQACGQGSTKIVHFLLDSGVSIEARDGWNSGCMFYAAANGHVEIAELLISRGIDVNARYRMDLTALIIASASGREEMVELLIRNNANISLKDAESKTALDYAIEHNHPKIVKMLKEARDKATGVAAVNLAIPIEKLYEQSFATLSLLVSA